MVLKPHETRILETFYHLYYLSSQQVTDLLYSKGTATTVHTYLSKLTERHYLLFDRPYPTHEFVYLLATKGRNHLEKNLGYDFSKWKFPSDMKDFIRSSHLPHCLGVNNFIILAERFVKQYPYIKITRLLHDFTLKRLLPVDVVKPDTQINFFLPPDAESPRGTECCLWLEYDRKTEKEQAWRKKIKRIVELMYYGFFEMFGSPPDGWTIAIVTPFGQDRINELMLWTERQLEEMNQRDLGGKFLFYALPERPDVKEVFLGKVWSIPFEDGKYSLIEL